MQIRSLRNHPGWFTLAVFVVALGVRLVLLAGPYDSLRHGSASTYGSAAIGLATGDGLTITAAEVEALEAYRGNLAVDVVNLRADDPREPLIEFLPGTAWLVALLWRITPWQSFLPLLVLQSLLDAALTAVFCLLVFRRWPVLAVLLAVAMAVNIGVIKRVLMIGYDYWPQFGVLVYLAGLILIVPRSRPWAALAGLGVILGAVVWFREITSLLPLAAAPFIYMAFRHAGKASRRGALARAAVLALPVVLSLFALSAYRENLTGNSRPTRSTFWHTFMAGVGQFPNPYGLVNNDQSVLEFARGLEPSLREMTVHEMWSQPDSEYELVLKRQAMVFVREHPELFLRNTLYRVGIMVSPFLYSESDMIPRRLARPLFVIGLVAIPLWLLGMIELWRTDRVWFWLVASVYCYFFAAFGWFYVLGRVILPFMFVNLLVYLLGAAALARRFLPGGRHDPVEV